MSRREYHGLPKGIGAGLLLLTGSLWALAWHLCPLPELLRRGDDGIAAADLGSVDRWT